MRSREEFIRIWRVHLAALGLFGTYDQAKAGLMTRASRILELPEEVDALLGRMYDDLKLQTQEKTNGEPARTNERTAQPTVRR